MRLCEGDEPIPGYRLVRLVGRGGFGIVWQAVGPGGIRVALKIIDLTVGQGRKELRAVQRVKTIVHPNLVPIQGIWLTDFRGRVLDEGERESVESSLSTRPIASDKETVLANVVETSDEGPGELILAMGLCEKSLLDRLKECGDAGLSGIPVLELLGYMQDAARGIDYLNSQVHDLGAGAVGIQHCDIKPGNMMIVGGAVQICDFGLARVLKDSRRTVMAYTPAYAAPETITLNEPSDSTDQYSLAVSYLELRCGRLPFDNDSHFQIAKIHSEGTLDLSELSEPERSVIEKAVSKDPSARFASASEMVNELRRAVARMSKGEATALHVVTKDRVEDEQSTKECKSNRDVTITQSTITQPTIDASNSDSVIAESQQLFSMPRKFLIGILAVLVIGFVCVILILQQGHRPNPFHLSPKMAPGGTYPPIELQNQLRQISKLMDNNVTSADVLDEIYWRFGENQDSVFDPPLDNPIDQADWNLMELLITRLRLPIKTLELKKIQDDTIYNSASEYAQDIVDDLLFLREKELAENASKQVSSDLD